jgi:phosphohistidine phosphatase SixA
MRTLVLLAAGMLLATTLGAQATLVIVVRHAEKAATGGRDPELSAAGQARAEALAAALAGSPIDQVFVTEYRRTSETAAPPLQRARLHPTRVAVGERTVAAHARAVAAALDSLPAGSAVLVVGHSNTVPAIVAAVSGGGPVMPDLADDEYSTLFVISRSPGQPPRVIRASYGTVGNPLTR